MTEAWPEATRQAVLSKALEALPGAEERAEAAEMAWLEQVNERQSWRPPTHVLFGRYLDAADRAHRIRRVIAVLTGRRDDADQ